MKFVLIHDLLPDYVCGRSGNSLRLGFQIREFILFFLISQPKHMLWVLKRTVSMRGFFRAPKTHV